MRRFFEGSIHAHLYAQFRPDPPISLVNIIISHVKELCPSLDQAIDVGTGSGQNARCLAKHFGHVVATDISGAQIQQAISNTVAPNVLYQVSAAECMPVSDGSCQLVTGCQCCHFFTALNSFYTECDRALAPGGVIALYGYNHPRVMRAAPGDGPPAAEWTEVNRVVQQVFDYTAEYWSPGRQEVERKYTDNRFRLPYSAEIRDETHFCEKSFTRDQLLGYMQTWSGFQTMVTKCGIQRRDNIITQASTQLTEIISQETADVENFQFVCRFHYFMLMARKPAAR